jgi:Ca2+-binding EF-hand superfamily protein
MHLHSQKEKCQQEIMSAFQAHDLSGRGSVAAKDLMHILTNFGEKLSRPEGQSHYIQGNKGTRLYIDPR